MVTAGAACVHCGAEQDLVAHHKLPRRYGGQDLYENLEPVCRSCHPRVEQEAAAEAKLDLGEPRAGRTAGAQATAPPQAPLLIGDPAPRSPSPPSDPSSPSPTSTSGPMGLGRGTGLRGRLSLHRYERRQVQADLRDLGTGGGHTGA